MWVLVAMTLLIRAKDCRFKIGCVTGVINRYRIAWDKCQPFEQFCTAPSVLKR